MNTRLTHILTIALVLLPILAPLAAPAAQAQYVEGWLECVANCELINATYASATVEAVITFYIKDPTVATENITVTLSVYDIAVGAPDVETVDAGVYGSYGTYAGQIKLIQVGSYVRVEYYYYDNDTGTFVRTGTVLGLIPIAQAIQYAINITYISDATGETITLTIDYVPPPLEIKLEIAGREVDGTYWLPRLGEQAGVLNLTEMYNGYEWRITSNLPIFDEGKNYTVRFNATIVGTSLYRVSDTIIFTAVDNYTLIPVNDTEALKVAKYLYNLSTFAEPWYIEGIDFANPIRNGDILEINATIDDGVTVISLTELTRAVIFVSVSKLEQMPISFSSPVVTIKLYDADANLNSQAVDILTLPLLQLNLTRDNVQMVLVFRETGPNTGIFEAVYNETYEKPTIFDLYRAGLISTSADTFNYAYNEIRVDDPQTRVYCTVEGTLKVDYYSLEEFDVAEETITVRQAIKCCPPLKITIKVKDRDLNLPETDIVAVARIAANSSLHDIVAYYYYGGNTSVPAVVFSIYAIDSEGNTYDLTTIDDLTIYFVKDAEGYITATIDLSKVDWAKVNLQAEYMLANITVVYYDLFNPQLEPKNYTDNVMLQRVDIEVDRTTIPISFRIVDSTNSDSTALLGACPACAPWRVDTYESTAQVIHITIYDDGANRDCCEIDTIPPSGTSLSDWLTLKIVKNGVELALERVTPNLYEANLSTIHADGSWSIVGKCYFELSNFTETGVNTGVFTGTLKIWAVIQLQDVTIRVAGCPSSWLEGAKLVLEYKGVAIGYAIEEIPFKTYTAEISINATSVHYGDALLIRVVDPDANLDPTVNETVTVEISFYCPLTRRTVPSYVNLTEVDEDAGIFEAVIVVDQYYAKECGNLFCAELNVIYVDRTPYVETTLTYADQLFEQNLTRGVLVGLLTFSECDCGQVLIGTSFVVLPYNGTITITYVVDKDELWPWNETAQDVTNDVVPAYNGTILTLLIEDKDKNVNHSRRDTLSAGKVAISIEGIVDTPRLLSELAAAIGEDWDLNETGDNTGVFAISFNLSALVAAFNNLGYQFDLADLVGKKIIITYYDDEAVCQATVCGAYAGSTVRVWIKPVDITGEVIVVNAVTGEPNPNDQYNCGCTVGPCPSATGDLISIYVKDLTLLESVPANVPVTGTLAIRLITDTVEEPASYGYISALEFVGYENYTLPGSDVVIPIPVYSVEEVTLYCTPPLAVAGQPYIVAPVGARLKFIYYDPVGATGEPALAEKIIGIGLPGLAPTPERAVNVTLTLTVFTGTAIVETTTLTRGLPATVKVSMIYDPLMVRSIVGTDTFIVVMFVKDETGRVILFDWDFVDTTVPQTSIGFSLSPRETGILEPGTYKIEVYAVVNLETLTPLSPVATLTITVTE